jgi:hypothetical protein
MIRCYFPCDEFKHGYVYSIDHAYKQDCHIIREARAKVAKFFGIYYDIRTKGEGYAGPEDLVASCMSSQDVYIDLKKKYGYSAFPHSHYIQSSSGYQKDDYNCGIIGIKLSLNGLKGKFKMLPQKDITTAVCNKLRKGFVTILRRMVEYLDPD